MTSRQFEKESEKQIPNTLDILKEIFGVFIVTQSVKLLYTVEYVMNLLWRSGIAMMICFDAVICYVAGHIVTTCQRSICHKYSAKMQIEFLRW